MTEMMEKLSSRERQIMEILIELGEASASVIQKRMPDAPGYSAVRTMLSRMVDKGYLKHHQKGKRYLYAPAETKDDLRSSALSRIVTTFFEGSVSQAVSGLLGLSNHKVSKEELDELSQAIERAKRGDS